MSALVISGRAGTKLRHQSDRGHRPLSLRKDRAQAKAWLRKSDSAHPPRVRDGTHPPCPHVLELGGADLGQAGPSRRDDRLLERSVAEQKARYKKLDDVTNQRKRELRMAARTPG
jgi:hypothetical protein